MVETYNGQYLVKDASQRREASQGAYDLRDSITGVLDDIDALVLSDDTAYAQDVEHMRQLATWTYNRVDVLCRSWDINLALGGRTSGPPTTRTRSWPPCARSRKSKARPSTWSSTSRTFPRGSR